MFLKCCCRECIAYEDSFAADSITGGAWTEEAGSWSISGGVLSTTDADALLLATATHPGGDGEPQVIRVDVKFSDELDRAGLIVAYDSAADYLLAEIWIEDGCGHVQFYERVAGVTTAVGAEQTVPFQMDLDTWHTVMLCYTLGVYPAADQLVLKVRSNEGNYWTGGFDVVPGTVGDQSALATGDPVDGTVSFGGFFQYLRGYDATYYPNCPRCETESNCQLHYDQFTRADAALPGCGWDPVAGTWSIASNQLTVASANAIITNNNLHPASLAEVQIELAFRAETDAVLRVLLDYEDDDNYLFVQLEPGTECGAVSFWRRTAGSNTQLGSSSLLFGLIADPDEMQFINVCLKDGLLRVANVNGFGSAAPIAVPGSIHSVGGVTQEAATPTVGLGTVGAEQIWVDEFRLKRMVDSNDAVCAECVPQNCLLYHDDPRNDASLTTFNCYWTIEAGSWTNNSVPSNVITIFSRPDGNFYELFETGADAMLLNETGLPLTTGEGLLDYTSGVEAHVLSFNFGDIVRALIGVEDDENYLYAEWEFAADDTSFGYMRVGKVVAGVDTELAETSSSITAGQPHSGVTTRPPGILRACYDGYELRGSFENVGAAFNTTAPVTARADAGAGWNPGRSGLATRTVTDSVYFAGFHLFHDIFGGDSNCAPCTTEATCGFCSIQPGGINTTIYDLTPPIVLVRIRGLEPNIVDGCPEANQFNDTFALPFLSSSSNDSCTWLLNPHFCDDPVAPATSELFSQVRFRLERDDAGLSAGTFGILPTVSILAYRNTIFPEFPGTTSNEVTWSGNGGVAYAYNLLPSYNNNTTTSPTDPNWHFDCLAFLADWLDLDIVDDGPGVNPLGAALSTASVKILV